MINKNILKIIFFFYFKENENNIFNLKDLNQRNNYFLFIQNFYLIFYFNFKLNKIINFNLHKFIFKKL